MTNIRSLSVSRNPLERLQEMEAAMNPVAVAPPLGEGHPGNHRDSNAVCTNAPTHARTNQTTNARASVRNGMEETVLASEGTHERANERTNRRANAREGVEEIALAQLLSTPLEADGKQGPFQAATVRMPAEVWRRIGWVASFSGRPKQEVIGEALTMYLEQLRKNTVS